MELAYFISGCSNPSALRDHWDYSKKDTSGAFTTSKTIQLTGISGSDDFSIFFSFDRIDKTAGSLLSNWDGKSGYFIGFNDDNQLFVATSTPAPYSFYFPEIELGKKNCLAITKNNTTISVYRYDLKSKSIYNNISKEFTTDTILSGRAFTLGKNNTLYTKYGLTGIAGTFDQFACFNTSLGVDDINIIFSGFLPIEKTLITNYSRNYYKNYYEQSLNPDISDVYMLSGFTGFLDYLSGVFPNIGGTYTASITGTTDHINNSISWSGYYYEAADIGCSPTGTKYIIGDTYANYTFDAAAEKIIFENKIHRSINEVDERLTSHLFSYIKESTFLYTPDKKSYFSYNIFEKYRTTTSSSFQNMVIAPIYTQGFNMNGVVVNDNLYCGLYYYANPALAFNSIGKKLRFNLFNKKFIDTDDFIQGYNLYWSGQKINNYFISNGYIETPNKEVDSSHPMVYDKAIYNAVTKEGNLVGINEGYGGASSAVTKYFSIGAAVVFVASDNRSTNSYRIIDNFKQISELNLIVKNNSFKFGDLRNKKENFKNLISNKSSHWELDTNNFLGN